MKESKNLKIESKKKDGSKQSKKNKEYNRPNSEKENYLISPPNGGWGWFVVLGAFYINIVADGIQLTFGIFLKPITEEFNAKYSEVALAGSLMFGIHLLMGPICAGCNKVFGLRPVTIMGSLLCCFGIGISYFSTDYWALYFSFGIIGGIGLGLVYMNSLVITSLYFTSLLPLAAAIVVCGSGVGTIIFALSGSFLLNMTTWKNSFLIEAALAGSMTIAAIIFKPLKPIKVEISYADSFPLEMGETSTRRRTSLLVKRGLSTDLSHQGSIARFQSMAWTFAENMVATDFDEKKKKCQWFKCCKKKKQIPESNHSLVLKLVKSEDINKKSFVEKVSKDEKKTKAEVSAKKKRRNSVYYKVIYRTEEEEYKNKCSSQLKEAILSMIDCRLLKSCSFFLFTLSGALQVASFLVIFTYEKIRIENLGYSENVSVYFVMTLGGANVFWRLFLGCISLIPEINYQALSICTIIIGGIATMGSCYLTDIYSQFAFCALFGLGMAGFTVFRMIFLVDLVEIDSVSVATGINLLFMGIGSILFPPVFGCMMENTNNYNLIFGLTGGLITISGLMLINLKKVKT